MKIFRIGLFILSIVLLYSCFKNQRRFKNLKGEWSILDWYEAGRLINRTGSMEFNDCKIRKEDCDGWLAIQNWDFNESDEASLFDYTFEAKDETWSLSSLKILKLLLIK